MAKHLLVVDDEPEIRDLIRIRLERLDNKVTVAANGKEALEQLIAHKDICALITDLQMPEMNGFELIEKVKEKMPDLPIAVVTGFIDEVNVQKAHDVGASEVFPKPINWRELQEWLKNVLPK
ncbi:response regulator [Bdellovibrionota bacterium]